MDITSTNLNELLDVVNVFDFESLDESGKPRLYNSDFYNEVTQAYLAAIGELTINCRKNSYSNRSKRGMPYKGMVQSIVKNVIRVTLDNPFHVAYQTINQKSIIGIKPKVISKLLVYRSDIKFFLKKGISFTNVDRVQINMKTYYNMFYGRVNAKDSILRSDSQIDFNFEMRSIIQSIIDGIINPNFYGIDRILPVLSYDTDTIIFENKEGVLEDLTRLSYSLQHLLGLTINIDKFDYAIAATKRPILINGNITTFKFC